MGQDRAIRTYPTEPHLGSNSGHHTLAERVRHEIALGIRDGRYRPGDRIGQEELAREYGTSRLPIREALRQLASEGLITLQPHAGARVARLDLAELEEVYLIRERIEPLAVARSVPHLSDDDLITLELLVSQLDDLSSPIQPAPSDGEDKVGKWIELDRVFHLTTFKRAQLPRLLAYIDNLWSATQQYRRIYGQLPNRFAIAQTEHRLLLEALKRRDPDDAERIVLMHIRRTRLTLEQHDDLFQ
jgi:DNA-binding GntR family transcriptional regulator